MRPFILIALSAVTMSASGLSQPLVRTLAPQDLATRAQAEALNKAASAALMRCDNVMLRFRPGLYSQVSLFIDDRSRDPGCAAKLTIDRAGNSGSVVFDGGQRPKFIDLVTHRAAFPGAIRNIELRDYMNGIVITRTNANKGESISWAADAAGPIRSKGLTISGVTFRRMGNWARAVQGNATGWGAIIFNFASNNRVERNRFEGLGNAVDSSLMHAIYLVGSSQNTIANNYFGAMDGAAVKLRNLSNSNRIEANKFRYGGEPLIQLWFCNQAVRGTEKCPIAECPSEATLFAGNRIIVSPPDLTRRGGGPVAVSHQFVSYEQTGGLRLVERFYAAGRLPKACGVVKANRPLVTLGGGNILDRAG